MLGVCRAAPMVSNDGTSVSIAGTKLSLMSSDRKRIVDRAECALVVTDDQQ